MIEEITPDAEFRDWLPPLSADERAQLEENLVKEGLRNPIVVWPCEDKLIIIDGYNRFEICSRRDIPYTIIRRRFKDRAAVIEWITENQNGQRNWSAEQKKDLIGRTYEYLKKHNKAVKAQGGHCGHLNGKTRDVVAKDFKIGPRSVQRAAEFSRAVEKVKAIVGKDAINDVLARRTKVNPNVIAGLAKIADEKPNMVRDVISGDKAAAKALGKQKPYTAPAPRPLLQPEAAVTPSQAQTVIWELGKRLLLSIDGGDYDSASKMMGKLIQEAGPRKRLLADAIVACAFEWPQQAVSYIRGTMNGLKERGNGKTKAVSRVGASTDDGQDWRARDARSIRAEIAEDAPDEKTRRALRDLLGDLPKIETQAEALRRYQAIHQR